MSKYDDANDKYYTSGFISTSLLLHVIWKNKELALQIYL